MLFKSILALQLLTISLTAATPIKLNVTLGPIDKPGKQPEGSQGQPGDSYQTTGPTCYRGTQFPPASEWLSFDELWAINKPIMLTYDSPEEVDYIKQHIAAAAAAAGVDRGVFLTMMMQESTGNVRAVSGDGVTPGLMQALGSPSCLGTEFGQCPESKIKDMIYAGALGTGQTEGISACFTKNRRQYAFMLRCYNSGSITDPLNLDIVQYGTPSYVSDVANRLKGFEPRRDCGFGVGIPSPGH
ncbi:hypothetical protein AJ78_04837 [Emergomyces pasteurianus Ep9510]|uniref:Transglycosylase SLT domain-containing protein n=1 Tax=Emergomyces pasteurianus Ep9510 TaxID=1447872 RepID=A0A1J9QI50_9EURO|nr:hypothetical protein AJ78_04837 [Emergomyces pasteurianus Ep9510]